MANHSGQSVPPGAGASDVPTRRGSALSGDRRVSPPRLYFAAHGRSTCCRAETHTICVPVPLSIRARCCLRWRANSQYGYRVRCPPPAPPDPR